MLKNFIRFASLNKCLPHTDECVEEVPECGLEPIYKMPAKPCDVIKFVIEKSQTYGYDSQMLKASIVKCGDVIYDNVAVFEDADTQLFVTVTLPCDIADCDYQIVISLDFKVKIISYIPETEAGCDGTIVIGIEGNPTGNFTYSIDGVTFQDSPIFDGICADEEYTFYLRYEDYECLAGEPLTVDMAGLGCGNYAGTTIQDLIDLNVYGFQIDKCTGNDFI